MKEDPIFQLILNKETAASQPSLSRFWDRIDEKTIRQFQDLNQALIDKVRLKRNTTEIIIDLDSTHSDTFGNQEGTNYNAHYQTNGYHPLVAFDGLTGDFLKAELRSGNVYTSNGVRDFLKYFYSIITASNFLAQRFLCVETAALRHLLTLPS